MARAAIARLCCVRQPTLIVHSHEDDHADLSNTSYLQKKLGGSVDMVVLDDCYHMITLDKQRHIVAERSRAFIARLAPVVKILLKETGIVSGIMTTIHSYTNDQVILDFPHKDLRRARAAAINMIPSSTGAAKALKLVLPETAGKLYGFSMRVPTPNVSIVDLTYISEKPTDVQAVNAALKAASEGELKGILGYEEHELVSSDFKGDKRSSIVDAKLTKVVGNSVKVLSWYDNEWGYSNRVVDLVGFLAKKGL